ncbi:hypothetical protein [Sphingomonas rubra]|uniref:FMN-binding domain-containing protein n=1 Tax=Sphingomonas rubra TaxID=634430 RepID=A0A1I5TBC3_9SPHN|nr:hypothetical protein [Sphingomonas rubra]SFP80121.1 hypothetical protein SAMN04488241_107186 [Sphingomonas rubra]
MRLSSKHAAALAGVSASLLGADATMVDAQTVGSSEAASKASRFADGVYTATGQYGGLPSSLTVRVRLVRGTIAGVEVGTPAKNPTSLGYQKRFAAAVPAVVVGRPIDQVRVGKLAGASGCPDGFNAAIAKIRTQAAR